MTTLPTPREHVRLVAVRITLKGANVLVTQWHRHHKPVVGAVFAVACRRADATAPCGCVIVGRPVARMRDDGQTAEITRLVTDGTPNACTFLQGRAVKAAFAMGFTRIGTYTLPSEGGGSMRAGGWKLIGEAGGGKWTRPSRQREDTGPTERKWLWEKTAEHRAAVGGATGESK